MIGPSSGSSDGPTSREVVENPVRIKRKIFEDLDIESLCDEVCHQSDKNKRFIIDPIDESTRMKNIVDTTDFSSSSSLSSSSSQETTGVGGSMARLEVLVVDGNWDPSNLGNAEFTDISSSIANNNCIDNLDDVNPIDNGYGTILSYWTEQTGDLETTENNCTNNADSTINPSIQQTNPISNVSTGPPIEDQENGNLSWLLDFKLDSLIEAPEERTILPPSRDFNNGHRNKFNGNGSRGNGLTSCTSDRKNSTNQHDNATIGSGGTSLQQDRRQVSVETSNYSSSNNRSFASSRYGGPKKPPFTYTELIEHALQERGELTVSAIYQWISEHFPYYKSNDDRWKNSVRHNLSINPHFRKGSKAPHGAGHLWAIANRGDTRPRQLITANGTVIPTPRQLVKNLPESKNARRQINVNSEIVTMDEVEAATASISQPEDNNQVTTSVTLEHCAEQILSGIKREVEVQYLVPMVVPPNENEPEQLQLQQQTESNHQQCPEKETERDCWNVLADFLNPVSKEEVAEECGLIGEGYLVTDLNPTALGLNMVEPEIITPDSLFGEELSFQFYELTSPSQLQSA